MYNVLAHACLEYYGCIDIHTGIYIGICSQPKNLLKKIFVLLLNNSTSNQRFVFDSLLIHTNIFTPYILYIMYIVNVLGQLLCGRVCAGIGLHGCLNFCL